MVGETDKRRNSGPRRFFLYEHGAPEEQRLETQWLDDFPGAAAAWLPPDSFVGWHRLRSPEAGRRATLLAISSKGNRYEIGVATWDPEAPTHKEHWLELTPMGQMSRIQSWEHLHECACRRRAGRTPQANA